MKNVRNQEEEKIVYVKWAVGFMHKRKRCIHPYLRLDFKFDSDKKPT